MYQQNSQVQTSKHKARERYQSRKQTYHIKLIVQKKSPKKQVGHPKYPKKRGGGKEQIYIYIYIFIFISIRM